MTFGWKNVICTKMNSTPHKINAADNQGINYVSLDTQSLRD